MDEVSAPRAWLNERPNDSGSDFLFVSQKGPFDRNTVNRIFAKYCRLTSEARVATGEKPIAESCWHIHALKHSRVPPLLARWICILLNCSPDMLLCRARFATHTVHKSWHARKLSGFRSSRFRRDGWSRKRQCHDGKAKTCGAGKVEHWRWFHELLPARRSSRDRDWCDVRLVCPGEPCISQGNIDREVKIRRLKLTSLSLPSPP